MQRKARELTNGFSMLCGYVKTNLVRGGFISRSVCRQMSRMDCITVDNNNDVAKALLYKHVPG